MPRSTARAGEPTAWATWEFFADWSHMKKGYPTWIREAGVQEAWKNRPGRLGDRRGHAEMGG